MKLGVYVGSFNPVHKGHIQIVRYLLDKKYIDKVLIIPTKEYWNKTNLAPLEDRINMLKYYETDDIKVDITHNNYEFTYEILRSIKKEYNCNPCLIIGSDNLKKLDLWKNIDEILRYKIIVLKREKENKFKQTKKNITIIDDWKIIKASSTEVRNGNTDLLDKPVYEYIKKKKLYNL